MKFGLMFFGGNADTAVDRYELVHHCARYADDNGLAAVWLPERHFSRLGGLFSNPSVVLASLAAITKRVSLRTGSIVLPLHDPAHVVETFSAIDNLSNGRVGLGFASGWNPDDFAFKRDRFAGRADLLFTSLETVRQIWATGAAAVINGLGSATKVNVYPPPVQSMPPMWIAVGRSPSTFQRAGAAGVNLLTHMLDVDIDQLGERIALYRDARRSAGLDPKGGTVTVMLHTYIAESEAAAISAAKGPYCEFLKSNIDLFGKLAESRGIARGVNARETIHASVDEFAEILFDRFYASRSLIGTLDSCQAFVRRLESAGVDEIACLLDFGPSSDLVKEGLLRISLLQGRLDGGATCEPGIAVQTPYNRLESDSTNTGEEPHALVEAVDGRPLAKVNDSPSISGGPRAGIYFDVEWLPVASPLLEVRHARCDDVAILFAVDRPLADAVAQKLREGGGTVYVVQFGTEFRQTNDDFVIDRTREDHYNWVLGLVFDRHERETIRVLNLIPLGVGPAVGIDEAASRLAIDLCYDCSILIAKVCSVFNKRKAHTLHIATENAVNIPDVDQSINVYNSLALGIGRVLEYEANSPETRVIDFGQNIAMPGVAAKLAALVMRETTANAPRQVALRGEQIFAPVLVEQSRRLREQPKRNVVVRPGASYLISGGLGALGLLFAARLVEQGAKTLILCHRRELPPRQAWPDEVKRKTPHADCIRQLLKLEASGAVVHAVRVDVTDFAEVSTKINELYRQGVPRVAGVLHAAGVAPDFGPFEEISLERSRAVMDPKIRGALNLHRLFLDTTLDFFTLFSSWAGLLGALGKNLLPYSVANGFLDALSRHRRQAGLASLSIAWGDWTGIGMRAAAEARGGSGLLPLDWAISPSTGISAFGDLVGSPIAVASVTPVNWRDFGVLFPDATARGLLRRVVAAEHKSLEAPRAMAQLTLPGEGDVERWLLGTLSEGRQAIGDLDYDKTLAGLGLDSLEILELRRRIMGAFGCSLPLKLLMGAGTSLRDIVKRIATEGDRTISQEPDQAALNAAPAERTVLPLSSSQERMWVLNQMDPSGTAYNMSAVFHVRGQLDVSALTSAARAIVARHEALRTSFGNDDGIPYQCIEPEIPFEIIQIECARMDKAAIEDLIDAQLSKPFDLGRAPLMRIHVYRCNPEERYVALEMHHIIADGWSNGILLAEFEALYAHHAFRAPLTLPNAKAQYREFATAQLDNGTAEKIAAGLEYWKHELAGAGEFCVPTDYHLGHSRAVGVHRIPLALSSLDCAALSQLARDRGTTGYTLLLALFMLMLHEFSDSSDIVVGMPVANRDDSRFRNTIGLFANTMPIKMRIPDDVDLTAFLSQLHAKVVNGMEHSHAPFEKIVSAVAVTRNADRNPLYQVLFAPQIVLNDNLRLRGLDVSPVHYTPKHSVVDITASVTLSEEGTSGYIEFDKRLFAQETAASMVQCFHELAGRAARGSLS
ncbi:MupA/Atu3671 family FMN-dependent luciferase-like monooxygenase [Bradyrhizobium sp. USDA 4506]